MGVTFLSNRTVGPSMVIGCVHNRFLQEIALVSQLQDEFANRNVKVVGLSVDTGIETAVTCLFECHMLPLPLPRVYRNTDALRSSIICTSHTYIDIVEFFDLPNSL